MSEKKIANILSIDMDYILSPCINLYNDLVHANTPPEKIWDKIAELRNADKHLSFENEALKYVFDVFVMALTRLQDKKNVMFALNHDAILFELASKKHENAEFEIYNIDHHHDIYYNENARLDVDKYNATTLANWVWYLDKHNKLNRYYWIHNPNSLFPDKNIKSKGKMDGYLRDKLQQIYEVKEWDYIFVCNSPHWLPRDYDVFFEMLIDIYQNMTGVKIEVNKEIFSPNGLSRDYPYDKK